MLTDAELASMRAMQALTFVDTALIGRRSYASDGAGGQFETLTYTETLCRVAAVNNMPAYQMFAGVANEAQLWRITFAADTDVRKNDKVLVGTRTFEVAGVLAPSTYETARVAIAVER